jgi:Xaa-Pro dipeptidase
VNSDSGVEGPPLPDFEGFDKIPSTHAHLRDIAVEVRVFKSDAEIELLQRVNDIGSDGHLATIRHAKANLYEFQLESVFMHHCYYNGGCRNSPYTSICGCGINSATLHYGHAGAPNDFQLKDGQVMLMDMGCELKCYGSDITCSFPVSGKFTPNQKTIFDTVALCQIKVMQAMKPGVEWVDMHELALRTVVEGLTNAGVLVGPIDEMMKAYVGAFFMPHGLGHLMGVATHDVGGYPTGGALRDTRFGYKSLRMQRKLEPRMVLTVEPGIYFVDYLLDDLETNAATKCFVVKDKLNEYRGFGGIRLEDSVVVTENGIRNLTTCPRTTEDVEAVMAGTITDKKQFTRLI